MTLFRSRWLQSSTRFWMVCRYSSHMSRYLYINRWCISTISPSLRRRAIWQQLIVEVTDTTQKSLTGQSTAKSKRAKDPLKPRQIKKHITKHARTMAGICKTSHCRLQKKSPTDKITLARVSPDGGYSKSKTIITKLSNWLRVTKYNRLKQPSKNCDILT